MKKLLGFKFSAIYHFVLLQKHLTIDVQEGFPLLERKGLCSDDNNCNTKAGGDALSALAYCICANLHTHIPDRRTQNSAAWQRDPVEQINKLLIRGGKCDWPLSSGAMIYCMCHRHLKVTLTLGQ